MKSNKSSPTNIKIPEHYKYLLPAGIIILLIAFIPIFFQIYMSLHRFSIGFPWETRVFVGIRNYLSIFASRGFFNSVRLTIIFAFAVTFFALVIGLIVALILNREFKFKPIVAASLIIPQTISPSIIGLTWRLMYNNTYGIINHVLRPFGLNQVWLGESWAFFSVTVTAVWLASSFMSLVALAGLESLPSEPYEAAKIDGASPIQSFIYITLPMLRPVLGIAIILQQVATLHIFGLIYTMTGGGPGGRTNVLALHVYRTGLDAGNVGVGTSTATILAFLALMTTFLFIKLILGGERN